MAFTHPAAIWLIGLCLLPLLLSRRRATVRHAVSNAYLWRQAVQRQGGPAPRRVRMTALVAAQMACIAALALALADPVVTSNGGRTAIVIDLSASMAARHGQATRLDTARTRLRAIIASASRFARIRVVAATAAPHVVGDWTATDPRLLAAIDALTPTAGTADLRAAIDLAAAGDDVDDIIALSDGPTPPAGNGAESPWLRLERVGEPADNAAITHVAVRRGELGGRAGDVVVGLHNYGTTARDTEIEIAVDGRPVHRSRAQTGPGRARILNLSLADLGRYVTARLVEPDALALDDARSVAVPLTTQIRVAIAGPADSFLERALAVNPSVSLHTYGPDERLEGIAAAGDIDVLVCDRCRDPAVADRAALVVTGAGGSRLHDALHVVAIAHPLVEGLEAGELGATVNAAAGGSSIDEVVLRVGGAPAVTALDGDERRRVNVHLDLATPDFILSPAFPVLVANAVAWLAARQEVPSEITAGEPLAFTWPEAAAPVSVVGPDGRPRESRRAGARVVVTDTNEAGQYRVQLGSTEHLVAVNPNVAAESDLSAVPVASAGGTAPAAPTLRRPVRLGRWLILLALALLALEWHLRMRSAW